MKSRKPKTKPKKTSADPKLDADLKRCRELIKNNRKPRPKTSEQKLKEKTKEINNDYKKIQNNLQNIDDIKENVNTIKQNIDDEINASSKQVVYDEETGKLIEPIEQGEQKRSKYTSEQKNTLIKKVINDMNKMESIVDKNKSLTDYEKEEKKNLERKKLLVAVNNNKVMPEMVKLEVLDELNKEVLKRHRALPKMFEKSKIKKYKENPLMLTGVFDNFKIVNVFNSSDVQFDEDYSNPRHEDADYMNPLHDDADYMNTSKDNKYVYVEHNRFIKDILTSFVNDEMLKTNEHQLMLMSVVYENMNPWLKETGSRLIFYGGNLMRQIHKNINEYFDPESQDVFEKCFGSFVKKSDNDFSLMLGTNPLQMGNVNDPKTAKMYDDYHNQCFVEVSYILEKIRDDIMTNLYSHFSFFKYNSDYKNIEYNKLKLYLQEAAAKIDSRIKINDVKLSNRADQLILYPDNTVPLSQKRKINLYKNNESNVIYNSYNNAIHFEAPLVSHFSLLRSKINFSIDGTFVNKKNKTYKLIHTYGGELIDFGMPYLMNDDRFSHKGSKYKKIGGDGTWINKWLDKKVEVIRVRNEKYDFEYTLYGNRYQVELLFYILFFVPGRPWLAVKYDKRIARAILFEFYWLLDQYPVGAKSLKIIKEIFRNMSSDMLQIMVKETKLAYDTLETKEDLENYNAWMNTLKLYVSKIISGIDSLIEFFNGKKKITKQQLFKINIA